MVPYESDSYLQSSKKAQNQREMFNSLQHNHERGEEPFRARVANQKPRALINSLSNLGPSASQIGLQKAFVGQDSSKTLQDQHDKSRSGIAMVSVRAGANSVLYSNKENTNPNVSRTRLRSHSPLAGSQSGMAPAAVVIRPSFAKVVDLNTSYLYNN